MGREETLLLLDAEAERLWETLSRGLRLTEGLLDVEGLPEGVRVEDMDLDAAAEGVVERVEVALREAAAEAEPLRLARPEGVTVAARVTVLREGRAGGRERERSKTCQRGVRC